MAHQVKIIGTQAATVDYTLPNGLEYPLGSTVTLTDKQFALISPTEFSDGSLQDLGPVFSLGHYVTAEASFGTGGEGVDLPNGVTLQVGQSILLDDDTFSRIALAAFTDGVLIDGGFVLAQRAMNPPRYTYATDTMVQYDSMVLGNAGHVVSDAVITAGTLTTITSATNLFLQSDVGRPISDGGTNIPANTTITAVAVGGGSATINKTGTAHIAFSATVGVAYNETLPALAVAGFAYVVNNVGANANVTVVPNAGQTLVGGNVALTPAASKRFYIDSTGLIWTAV